MSDAAKRADMPLDSLLAAALRLMTHYASCPSADAAGAVIRLLDQLSHHPQAAKIPVLHKTYARVLADWHQMITAQGMTESTSRCRIAGKSVH